MAETERFVKSEVAGRYLGLSALTIRRMAHQGKIPAYGLPCGAGKFAYRFKLSELLTWANNLKKSQ
jgi:excisionase family DNA binding protein